AHDWARPDHAPRGGGGSGLAHRGTRTIRAPARGIAGRRACRMTNTRPTNSFGPRLALACALVLAGTAGQWVLASRIAARRMDTSATLPPLERFPERLGEWEGSDRAVHPQIIEDIKVD